MDARNTEAERMAMIEREVVLAKVYEAPRELLFRAWTEREHFTQWFGPKGFTIAMHEFDMRVGGRVRFDMVGPDGTVYPNRMVFLEINAPERLIFDHGSDKDEDADKFRMTVTFDSQSDGKTVVTLRQLHPSKVRRDAVIGFGAVEYGLETLEKLGAHARGM